MPSNQQPLGSGFSAYSTTSEVIDGIDLTGSTAIVTGGYSGLGRETALTFAAAGARVIVPTRDPERAAERLRGVDGVELREMDLLDPASIDAFAAGVLADAPVVHLLVNSAGIMATPEWRDARGYEAQFATNHLGHFQLTARLWPGLAAAGGARVVSVSSMGHRYSDVVFDDIHFEHRQYHPYAAYGQSKTANVLFAVELDRRGAEHGVRAFSLHPGSIVGTGLEKHVPQQALIDAGVLNADGTPIIDPARQLKRVEQGAATSVWCATSPSLDGLGGVYCENCDVAPMMVTESTGTTMADSTRLTGVMPYAVDPERAARLWTVSQEQTGVEFL